MESHITPDTFNHEKYKKTGWTASLISLEVDNFQNRLVVRVATGRKYWPLFTELIDVSKGLNDPALVHIKHSLKKYTHPMIDRFVKELEIMLSDIYKIQIIL